VAGLDEDANKKAFNIVNDRVFIEQINDLYNALEKGDLATANGMIGVMVESGNKMAADALTVLLEYQDVTIQSSSAMALGRLGDSSVVKPLLNATADPSEKVRVSAVTALGMIGDKSALLVLESIPLTPQEPHMTNAVRNAIFRINHPGETPKVTADIVKESLQVNMPENQKDQAAVKTSDGSSQQSPQDPKLAAINKKNPAFAALASFLVPGLGQIYNGESFSQGLKYLIGTILGLICLFFPGIIVWLYGISNAYSVSNKINAGETIAEEVTTGRIALYTVTAVVISFVIGVILAVIFTLLIAGFVFSSVSTNHAVITPIPVVIPPDFTVMRVNDTTVIFTMQDMGGASSVEGFYIQEPAIADPTVLGSNVTIQPGKTLTVTDPALSGTSVNIVATSMVNGHTEAVVDTYV
jgi:TM2 domain-containing membrane protein YozV